LNTVDWRQYIRDRKIAWHPAGFHVIVPDDVEQAIPFYCGVCDRLLRSRDDELAYQEFQCCHLCALKWAHPRRAEWKSGWRPTQDQVLAAVSERVPLLVVFDVD